MSGIAPVKARGPRFDRLPRHHQAAVLALVEMGYPDTGDPTSPNTLRVAIHVADAVAAAGVPSAP